MPGSYGFSKVKKMFKRRFALNISLLLVITLFIIQDLELA